MSNIFTKTKLDLNQPLSPTQGLILLSSYPKSGNTWTRLFFYALQNRAKEIDLDHFAKNISTMDSQKTHFASVLGVDPNSLTQQEIAETIPKVQRYLALKSKNRELIKTHTANGEFGGTPTMDFSVIRAVVYIIRNPLDVVASFASHMGYGFDRSIKAMATSKNWLRAETKELRDEAPQVAQLMGSWSEHVAGWTGRPDPRVTVVRYEDLKHDTVVSFKRVVDGLGLRKTRAEVAEAVAKTDFAQIQAKEAKKGFTETVHKNQKFFRKGQTGGWREELSDDQVKEVIRHHAFQMNRFGYIPEEYHDFAKGVMIESQTAKHFIAEARRERQAQEKNIKRRSKPGKKNAGERPQVAVPRTSVMFPSAIKRQNPTNK